MNAKLSEWDLYKHLTISIKLPQILLQRKDLSIFYGRSKSEPFFIKANKPPSTQSSTTFDCWLQIKQVRSLWRNNTMKHNSSLFYFKIPIKSTHTSWASNQKNLFSKTTSLQNERDKVSLLSSSHVLLIIHWSKIKLKIKLEVRLKG
jgi:pyridoxine/pyridoxamine 5'-phosphate oxidase